MTTDAPPPPEVSGDLFRTLLGTFATGVTVLTTWDAGDQPVGMTVSAVSAVSLDPPLLSVGVNRAARAFTALGQSSGFVLNILAARWESLSRHFAAACPEPFAPVPWERCPYGPVLLDGTLGHILCRTHQSVPAGDHTLFIGYVEGGRVAPGRPLIHFRGTYTTSEDS